MTLSTRQVRIQHIFAMLGDVLFGSTFVTRAAAQVTENRAGDPVDDIGDQENGRDRSSLPCRRSRGGRNLDKQTQADALVTDWNRTRGRELLGPRSKRAI
jgi:hypothetical protein